MIENINVRITKVINNQNFEGVVTGENVVMFSDGIVPIPVTILKIPKNVSLKVNRIFEINIGSKHPPIMGYYKGTVNNDPSAIDWIKRMFK
jgi:hypothetical protein